MLSDIRTYGLRVALFNARFILAFRAARLLLPGERVYLSVRHGDEAIGDPVDA